MKKIFYLLSITFLVLQSCSSEDKPAPVVVIPDLIKPPYTVRYEVKFSSNDVIGQPAISYAFEDPEGSWRIASAPGTLHYIQNSELNNGWVEQFTVTVDDNPLRIEASVFYNPRANASYTTKMFVNNNLVQAKTWNRIPEPGPYPTFYQDSYDVY